MGRILETELAELKSGISLQRLVEASGVELKQCGKDLIGHCPFHDDKSPSLVISTDKNLWHCLGACQTGGSVIDWVMKKERVSFRHAVELLRSELPSLAAKNKTAVKLPAVLRVESDNQAALNQVIDYYHATLKQSSEALEYLSKRGLNNPDLIDKFKLGYANRTLGYRLPNKQTQAGTKLREQLQALGILRASGHEHFSGSIVIPIMDSNGIITEVYGRKILGRRLRKGTPMHTYLPGAHSGVFNIEVFKNYQEIILCESLIDALSFYVAGFYNVTASYGVSGFTADLLAAFKNHEIRKVSIAYDRDKAGDIAAEKLAKELSELGIDCFRVLFPNNMDANEYACQAQPESKSLDLLLRKAEWLSNGRNKKAAPKNIISESCPIAAKVTEQEISITQEDRYYRVRGLHKNMSYEQLKINLLIKYQDKFHVDTLDIYNARHRTIFIKQASIELSLKEELLKQDLGRLLLKLEELQDQQIQGILTKKDQQPKMSDSELKAALDFLESPNLLSQIIADFEQLGIVGEKTNKLVGYLAAVSRKLDKPLAVMVQSSSAAGKSSLMEAILSLMPAEERVHYSAMTGQALFYMGEQDLKHKILSIAEETGATQTAYALKLLQSEGEVSIASTGKNPTTGNLETQEYRVEGPVMLFSTTTAIDIDEELMNRCLILSVDESRAQTQAIHQAQRNRRTLTGLRAKQSQMTLMKLHQNAQRLLRPLAILNPYAEHLTFLSNKTRTRRDHEKYLTLIDSIALLYQYQREIRKDKHNGIVTEYIEATLEDIELANNLAHEVLGKTLDELPPQTRRLLELIAEMMAKQNKRDYRFSRKNIRDYTGWSDGQLKIHCHRLEELEYLLVHNGGRGKTIQYELLYDGEPTSPEAHLMGLIDIESLKKNCDAQKSGSKSQKAAPSQAQVNVRLDLSQNTRISRPINNNGFKTIVTQKITQEPLLEQSIIASHHNLSR